MLLRSLFALALAALPLAGAAQPVRPPKPPDPPTPAAIDDAAERFGLAQQYVAAGQPERAVALLEDLFADDPTSFPVYTQLKAAYEAARRPDDVLRLVEGRLAREGPSPALFAERAAALAAAGRDAEADAAWTAAVALAPEAEMTYRTVSGALGELRDYERAAGVLRDGRARLGDSTLFRFELGNLYGLSADFPLAAAELLSVVATHPAQASAVQSRLSRLIEGEGAAEAFQSAIERAVRREPLNRGFRELAAWIALEQRDYAAALDATLALDRLEREGGESVYGIAEAALAADALDVAERAYADILDRHGDGPLAALARLGAARVSARAAELDGERAFDAQNVRVGAPRYEAALAGFLAFAAANPAHPEAVGALRRAADLQRLVFRDYAEAERLLLDVAARADDPAVALRARLDLGAVAVQRGDLGAARTAFAQVEERARTGEAAEEARLELARLDFYEGQFASALTRVEAMGENTASDAANDAITLKLVLRENEGPDSTNAPLAAYARASLLLRQQRAADALDALDRLLAEVPSHAVADEALFLRATALRALGRPADAAVALDAFAGQHPTSHLAERALFLRGELFERDAPDAAQAQRAYLDLLARFPGSLLAPEARARLRRLRGDAPEGIPTDGGPPR